MAEENKACARCGKPLVRIKWNRKGTLFLLVCDDSFCSKFRQPQGTEKRGNSNNYEALEIYGGKREKKRRGVQ